MLRGCVYCRQLVGKAKSGGPDGGKDARCARYGGGGNAHRTTLARSAEGAIRLTLLCVPPATPPQILSESGIASGIRRVEAVAGPAAVEYLNQVGV